MTLLSLHSEDSLVKNMIGDHFIFGAQGNIHVHQYSLEKIFFNNKFVEHEKNTR
jgi:hypothetical protein